MCRAQRTEKKWRIKYIRNVIARVTRIKKFLLYMSYMDGIRRECRGFNCIYNAWS